jgi:hypothetical protein
MITPAAAVVLVLAVAKSATKRHHSPADAVRRFWLGGVVGRCGMASVASTSSEPHRALRVIMASLLRGLDGQQLVTGGLFAIADEGNA